MPTVYKGRVFSVEVAIVRHPPAVVIVPVEDDGRVVQREEIVDLRTAYALSLL